MERLTKIDPETDFSFSNDDDSIEYLMENLAYCDKDKASMLSKIQGINPALIEMTSSML